MANNNETEYSLNKMEPIDRPVASRVKLVLFISGN